MAPRVMVKNSNGLGVGIFNYSMFNYSIVPSVVSYNHRVIYSTRVNTPIRTAENFEAVE